MKHEISIFGVFVPSLLVCFLVAAAVWLVIDQLMLRLSLWRFSGIRRWRGSLFSW